MKASNLYARAYDLLLVPADVFGLRRWRIWAASLPGEKILEIGVGTGLNIQHYKPGTDVFAVDPASEMLRLAAFRCRKFNTCANLIRSRAEYLPFPDAAFDAALGTLVFCTVNDPNLSFRELYRVLKPGSPIRLFEHVRLGRGTGARLQDFLTPAWKHVAGGCHLNRNTLDAVENSGFKIISAHKWMGGIFVAIEGKKPGSSAVLAR